ncbi:MAG: aspartate carbamoyltransferase catalytic subunit [Chloroherpetonaceae bacterium]
MFPTLSKPFLLSCDDLTTEDIELIFERARYFEDNFVSGMRFEDLKGINLALAFFENSTRTKLSFELAAKRLSADIMNFNASTSSLQKGESLLDTLKTIEAMGVQIYVIRHSSSGAQYFLQRNTSGIIINAGDGKHEHPTQALLDNYTLLKYFRKIKGLKITIVGDIFHSRVARSNIILMRKLGAEVKFLGPGTLLPRRLNPWNVDYIDDIDEAIEWSDVVLVLRVQKERMNSGLIPSIDEYANFYGVTLKKISKKPNLVIMHPGPVNYGVELDYEISTYPNCLIQTQVSSGVYVRMAVLSLLSNHLKN